MAGFYGGGPRPPGMPSPAPTNKYGQGAPKGWKSPYGLVNGYPVGPDGTVYSWDTWCVLYPFACPPNWRNLLRGPPLPELPPSVVPTLPRPKPRFVAPAPRPKPPPAPPPPKPRGPVTPTPTPYVPPYVPPRPPTPVPQPMPSPFSAPYQPPPAPPSPPRPSSSSGRICVQPPPPYCRRGSPHWRPDACQWTCCGADGT